MKTQISKLQPLFYMVDSTHHPGFLQQNRDALDQMVQMCRLFTVSICNKVVN